MLHEAKWFGVSLALHMTVASGLIAMASRNAEISPQAIMVILDNLDSPSLPRYKNTQIPVRAVVRPVAPVIPATPVPAKPEMVKLAQAQPEPVQSIRTSTVPVHPPEQSRIRDVQKTVPEQAAALSNRQAPPSVASQAMQQAATEGRLTPEKAQQRYLKEHFMYISALISKQLEYPLMARKMNWSGKVVVAFTIAEDGSVHAIRVTETSGFPVLDKSALETVRRVAPFPRPPVRAEIVVPINFKLAH